jgi:hypothetical protein
VLKEAVAGDAKPRIATRGYGSMFHYIYYLKREQIINRMDGKVRALEKCFIERFDTRSNPSIFTCIGL